MSLSVDAAATVKASSASSSSLTTAAITTQATGSGLVVDVSWFSVATFVSLLDNKGNALPQLGSFVNSSANAVRNGRFYQANAVGGAGHTFTLTISSAQPCTIYAQEIKTTNGAGLTIDQTATVTEDSASPYTSQAITTTIANEILVAFHGDDPISGTATHTVGNSFTLSQEETDGDARFTGWVGYRIVSATGTYNTTNTQTGSINSTIPFLSSFSEAPSSGPGAGADSLPVHGTDTVQPVTVTLSIQESG